VVRKLPIRLPVGLHLLDREGVEQRPDHWAGHPVAAVNHHSHALNPLGVDVAERGLAEGVGDVFMANLARRVGRRPGLATGDDILQLADPGVARKHDRPALHELRPGVGLRIVRRCALEPAVQPSRPDGPVQHLRPDHPHVEYVSAFVGDASRVLLGHRGRRQAHVAPDCNAHFSHRDVLEIGEDAREAAPDPVRELLVDLIGVDPPNVVRLED
jgi:hypothetical protein